MGSSEAAKIQNYRRSNSLNREITLPWDKFNRWIHCICVVTFDLEIGQALELVYPKHAKLSEKEKSNICYLAFPDSNSGCMGDTRFHFRLRCTSPLDKKSPDPYSVYNQAAPIAVLADPAFYFGFVYFRQVKDKSISRGYLQKSLVLMTKLPFVNLFSHVVETIAQEFFNTSLPGLEAACHDIDQWSPPVPGATLNLPLLGTVLQVRLPNRFDKPGSPEVMRNRDNPFTSPLILPTVHEPNIYESLLPIMSHVQLLWELVLLGEPLAIMAQSPTVCSSVVQSLVSLIWPLQYCLEYRPFFTIHDTEFKEFTSKSQSIPRVMIGVTNPFFAKTLENWPNVVRVGESVGSATSSPIAAQKIKKSSDLKTLDSKPGIYTRYKPFLSRDKAILKRLMKGIHAKRPSEAQCAILRRHFLEMTQSFLIPLERYLASLMPLQKNISPWKSAPKVREFDVDDFVATLDAAGPQLTCVVKGDWIGLYKRFFHSENFIGWLKQRQKEVNHKLQLLHLEVLCNSKIYESLETKQEVELVDIVLKLKDKLTFVEENADSINTELKTTLKKQYELVLESLREDLRFVLIKQTQQIHSSVD